MNTNFYQNELRRRTQKQDDQIRAVKVRLWGLKPPPRGGMSSYFESIQRSTNEFIRRRMKNPKAFGGVWFLG